MRAALEAEAPVLGGFPPTSFSPVTAITETDMWTPAVWAAIPANDPEPGAVYLLEFGGIYSNRTTSTPTSTWTPRWGQGASGTGIALGASAAIYSGAALTNSPLYGWFVIAFRTVGTSGTATGNGSVVRGDANAVIRQPIGGTVATIDTTAAGGVKIAHTWSAANASNTITVQWVHLRQLN